VHNQLQLTFKLERPVQAAEWMWRSSKLSPAVQQLIKHIRCCCPTFSLPCLQLEITTGRIAMIGFVGLILNEAYFQRPFFPHLF
jgi:hypothetical protein